MKRRTPPHTHLSQASQQTLAREIGEAVSEPLEAIALELRKNGMCFECFVRAEIAALIGVIATDAAVLAVTDGVPSIQKVEWIMTVMGRSLASEVVKEIQRTLPPRETVN